MPQQPFSIKFTSDGLSDVLQSSQKVRKSYLDWIESAEDSIKRANRLSEEFAGNQEKQAEADKLRANAAKTANRAIAQSFRELGIKSTASVEEQKERAISAFEAIAQSGTASVEDIDRAQEALNKRLEELNKQLDDTQGELEETGDSAEEGSGGLDAMAVAAGNLAAGIALKLIDALQGAVTWMTDLGSAASDTAKEIEVNLKSLDAALRGTGRSLTAAQVDEFAIKLGEETLTSREEVQRAILILTSFKKIGEDSFERVTSVAQDLSTVMGTNLIGSVRQLALALEDPVRGITALRRSGTTFSPEQREYIQQLVDQNKLLEAQNFILDEIEGQYPDIARAAADSFAGVEDTLGERQRRIFDAIGTQINEVLRPGMEAFSDALLPLTESSLYTPMVTAFQELFTTIGEIVGGTGDWSNLLEGGVRGAIEFVAELVRDVNETIQRNPEIVEEIISQVRIWGEALGVIIRTVGLALAGFLKVLPVLVQIRDAIANGMQNAIETFLTTVKLIIDPLGTILEMTGLIETSLGRWIKPVLDVLNPLKQVFNIVRGILGASDDVGDDIGDRIGGGVGGPIIDLATPGVFHPNRYEVTSPIGQRNGRFHAGTDFGTPTGTVLANIFGRGVVTKAAAEYGAYGGFVEMVTANGDIYRFGHLSQVNVRPGQFVGVGALLGRTGGEPGTRGAGRSTGPHLHLEYYPGGGAPTAFPAGRGGPTFASKGGPTLANNIKSFRAGRLKTRGRGGPAERASKEAEKRKRKEAAAARKAETKRRKDLKTSNKLRDAAQKLEEVVEAVEQELGIATGTIDPIDDAEKAAKERFAETFKRIEAAEDQIQKNIDLKKLENRSIEDENAALEKLKRLREEATEAQEKEIEKQKELFELRKAAREELERIERARELQQIDAQIQAGRLDALSTRGQIGEFDLQRARLQSDIIAVQAEFAQKIAELEAQLTEIRASDDQEGIEESIQHVEDLIDRYRILEGVKLDGLAAEIEQVNEAQREANRVLPTTREIAEVAFQGFEQFAGQIGDIITGSKDLGEALLELFRNIINQLSQLFLSRAFKALERLLFGPRNNSGILGGLFGGGGGGGGIFSGFLGGGGQLFGGLFGGGGGGGLPSFTGIGSAVSGFTPFGLNRGGLVRGPEGVDVIPARLSNNEFVVRAPAVRAVGVEALEYINSLGDSSPTRSASALTRNQTVNFNITTPDAGGFRKTQRQMNSQAIAELQRFRN